jgi:CpXC protein
MTATLSTRHRATCSHCHEAFDPDVVLIVDVENDDVNTAKAIDGSLNRVVCPHCSAPVDLDTPVLLYQPSAVPAIILSVRGDVRPEAMQTLFPEFIALLYSRLGAKEQQAWIVDGQIRMPSAVMIPRDDLRNAISLSGRGSPSGQLKAAMILLEQAEQEERFDDVVRYARQALEVLKVDEAPTRWASVKGRLAHALMEVHPAVEANRREAIHHLTDAQSVFTAEAYPEN